MRVDRKGQVAGSQSTIIAADQVDAVAIATAGEFVYWAAMGGVQARLRRARRDCASSCPIDELTALALGATPIIELVTVDDETLIAANGIATGGLTQSVQRIPAQNPSPLTFGSVPDAGDSGLSPGFSPITTD